MQARRYNLELGASIALYTVLLFASITVLNNVSVSPVWKIPICLFPMLGGLTTVWVIYRQVRRIDEMQRKFFFEVLCLSFTGTALITLSYGFLETVGFPRLSMFVVWPLMGALWLLCSLVSAWQNKV